MSSRSIDEDDEADEVSSKLVNRLRKLRFSHSMLLRFELFVDDLVDVDVLERRRCCLELPPAMDGTCRRSDDEMGELLRVLDRDDSAEMILEVSEEGDLAAQPVVPGVTSSVGNGGAK